MDFSPVWISIKTTLCASAITFVFGILAAWAVMFIKGPKIKAAVDGILTIPLVLPSAGSLPETLCPVLSVHSSLRCFLRCGNSEDDSQALFQPV